MNPRSLPAIPGNQAVRALTRPGFAIARVRRSHHVLRHPGPPVRAVSIPVHGNKTLPIGTLQDIVRRSGFTVEQFVAEL